MLIQIREITKIYADAMKALWEAGMIGEDDPIQVVRDIEGELIDQALSKAMEKYR